MRITIDLNEIEIKTLQCMYTEYSDRLTSYTEIDILQDDENRLKDLEDQLDVIEHLCYTIEGINK